MSFTPDFTPPSRRPSSQPPGDIRRSDQAWLPDSEAHDRYSRSLQEPDPVASGVHHLSIGPEGTGTLGSKWPGRGEAGPRDRIAATVSSKRAALARLIRRW